MSDIINIVKDILSISTGWIGLAASWAWAIPRKRVIWSIDNVAAIVDPHTRASGLTVALDGQIMSEPNLVQVTWRLTGNRGIQDSMYNCAPSICLSGRNCLVKSAWIERRSDSGVALQVSTNKQGVNVVALPKTALNPGEELRIRVLAEGTPDYAWVNGHIVDCPIQADLKSAVPDLFQVFAFMATLDLFMWQSEMLMGNHTYFAWSISLLTWWSIGMSKPIGRLLAFRKRELVDGVRLLNAQPSSESAHFPSASKITLPTS